MTESDLRAKVIKEAAGWLGISEGSARHKELVSIYNGIRPLPAGYALKVTDAWCAAFVSVVGEVMRMTDVLFPECSCPRMVQLYQKAGRWQEADDYVPQIGDVLFYGWSDSGRGDYQGLPDHVGLVMSCADGMISVIEGNYADAVGVRRIAVNARYIRGYGLPDYASKAAQEPKKLTGFPDVAAGAWYEEAIRAMAQKGILTGYPDGTYKPEQPVTRAELAAALYKFSNAQ